VAAEKIVDRPTNRPTKKIQAGPIQLPGALRQAYSPSHPPAGASHRFRAVNESSILTMTCCSVAATQAYFVGVHWGFCENTAWMRREQQGVAVSVQRPVRHSFLHCGVGFCVGVRLVVFGLRVL
jgi:hypothetical protein